ncbi:MAG: HlyC/CorC family transporter [Clostridia bacterium]|nr:HlyC/CorC family transporter [Clostridia bacterium]
MAEDSPKKSNGFFNRLFHSNEPETQIDAESEVIRVINMSCEQGLIDHNCKIMLENMFKFDDISAGELMTHRKDVVAHEDTDSLKEVVESVIRTGYSRIPIYHEDIDNIVGILYAKDLLRFVFGTIPDNFCLTDIVRDVFFVPSSKKCSELFAEMVAEKKQIAIVVDEYGGTDGIISFEDLIEFILGNIQDEFDNEEEEFKKISEQIYSVDASAGIDEINQLIGSHIPEDEFDTVAGLIMDKLGKIPNENEKPSIIIDGVKFTVAEVHKRRIVKVLVEFADRKEKNQ